MRIVADGCIDERLRLLFPDHDCQTARFAKLAGLKNGRLLDASEVAGFNVLLNGGPEHSGSAEFRWKVHFRGDSLRTHIAQPTNRLRDLELLVPAVGVALASIRPGEIVKIR